MNMKICAADTTCFDFDLLNASSEYVHVCHRVLRSRHSERSYHDIVVTEGGQGDFSDGVVLGLGVLQRLPMTEVSLDTS